MAAPERLVTFAEYMDIPDPEESLVLHHGRVVRRPIHSISECNMKNYLSRMIGNRLGDKAFVSLSIPYQPLPEYELWVAGVAIVSTQRWKSIAKDDYLQRAPEVVIEISGPSITIEEIEEERALALSTGCRQFWVIDPATRTIHVTHDDLREALHRDSQDISLPEPWVGGLIPVSEIFADRW
jgi:Uma2 family endonuclease